MTERITEDLVRSHFKADPIFEQTVLEEQKSSRQRIQCLFAKASKNQSGKPGFPEFIVSFHLKANLLLIAECKLDPRNHKSPAGNQAKQFAVDGIRHYISCAKAVDKDYAIIGLAVSGSATDSLQVTHLYSAAGSTKITETRDSKLLSIQSYLRIYENAAIATKLSDLHIQQKAVQYNHELHRLEIPEHERCTFVSAALVALQDDFFRSSYGRTADVGELVDLVLQSCAKVLRRNGISEARRETILRQYEGIRGHKITTVKLVRNRATGKEVLNDAVLIFIKNLHSEIYPLVLYEEQGYDVLGRFYREFVRYAGSDQATGLVLTPEHITDLFCDLVRLSVNDVVYDPCCGTAGFLIAALKRLLHLAGNDLVQIKAIKERQLIGSEVRADMFTYACSNMMMRGDGKSQIYNEDCFSNSQKRRVRAFGATVAMLNPPYSKTNGPAEQLRFVLNALDDLAPNGRCAAIVQMSAALTSNTEVVDQHRALLQRHRLDAVISCPNQLFYPIGVNTCIMVFTAHVAHPSEAAPTWFGYLKDDGFTIHKRRGRISADWSSKRSRFLANYKFKECPGLSVLQQVSSNDEWCAEAYLETDFSVLTVEHFERKLRTYLGFQYTSGRLDAIRPEAAKPRKVALNTNSWKAFRFDEIFDIRKGYYNKKPPETQFGNEQIVFIGATESNNGVTSIHDVDDVLLYSRNGEEMPDEDPERKIFPACAITVSNNGSVGNAFFQPDRFACSHDVNPLYLLDVPLTPEIGIFLCTVIEIDKYRWGYGRKWRPSRMPSSILKLPVTLAGLPDWVYMTSLVRSLSHSSNLARTLSSS